MTPEDGQRLQARVAGLAPRRCRQFKLSTDHGPTAHALVLSGDAKTQIQARPHTQTSVPLQPGNPATHTHAYIRHGTTTPCAALHAQTGQITAQTQALHHQQEFLAFLDQMAADSPADIPLHMILDHYATHKTAALHAWL